MARPAHPAAAVPILNHEPRISCLVGKNSSDRRERGLLRFANPSRAFAFKSRGTYAHMICEDRKTGCRGTVWLAALPAGEPAHRGRSTSSGAANRAAASAAAFRASMNTNRSPRGGLALSGNGMPARFGFESTGMGRATMPNPTTST